MIFGSYHAEVRRHLATCSFAVGMSSFSLCFWFLVKAVWPFPRRMPHGQNFHFVLSHPISHDKRRPANHEFPRIGNASVAPRSRMTPQDVDRPPYLASGFSAGPLAVFSNEIESRSQLSGRRRRPPILHRRRSLPSPHLPN